MTKEQEEDEIRKIESQIHNRVDAWVGTKKNNLRSLISTLHQIIWEDSGWREVSLGELVPPGALKKFYRKSVMIVHPDKTAGKSLETKVLAKSLFEVLSEAAKTAQL